MLDPGYPQSAVPSCSGQRIGRDAVCCHSQKHVKGQHNLEQQVAELKEVFAVYDEDGTGQLNQAEFVEAIVSAG